MPHTERSIYICIIIMVMVTMMLIIAMLRVIEKIMMKRCLCPFSI